MDDDDAKHLLLTIRRMALDSYPLKEGKFIDTRYAIALGMIAGVCTEALQAKLQNRPMQEVTNIIKLPQR